MKENIATCIELGQVLLCMHVPQKNHPSRKARFHDRFQPLPFNSIAGNHESELRPYQIQLTHQIDQQVQVFFWRQTAGVEKQSTIPVSITGMQEAESALF